MTHFVIPLSPSTFHHNLPSMAFQFCNSLGSPPLQHHISKSHTCLLKVTRSSSLLPRTDINPRRTFIRLVECQWTQATHPSVAAAPAYSRFQPKPATSYNQRRLQFPSGNDRFSTNGWNRDHGCATRSEEHTSELQSPC